VTSAPAVFQRKTDKAQQEIDSIVCYLDGIQTLGGIQRSIYKHGESSKDTIAVNSKILPLFKTSCSRPCITQQKSRQAPLSTH